MSEKMAGAAVDVALILAVVVLGALGVLRSEIVVGFLGSMVGARVATLRATQQPPPTSGSGTGGSLRSSGAVTRVDNSRLGRVISASVFATLILGLVFLFTSKHHQ